MSKQHRGLIDAFDTLSLPEKLYVLGLAYFWKFRRTFRNKTNKNSLRLYSFFFCEFTALLVGQDVFDSLLVGLISWTCGVLIANL